MSEVLGLWRDESHLVGWLVVLKQVGGGVGLTPAVAQPGLELIMQRAGSFCRREELLEGELLQKNKQTPKPEAFSHCSEWAWSLLTPSPPICLPGKEPIKT